MKVRWHQVRDFFDDELRRRRLTQVAVAERGDLKGQHAVSKLLANRKRGPSVETFLRALDGLGLAPSAFFAQLEHSLSFGSAAAPDRSTRGGGARSPHATNPKSSDQFTRTEIEAIVAAYLTRAGVTVAAAPPVDADADARKARARARRPRQVRRSA